MREIRIGNVKSLIHVVLALKSSSNFLVGKALYDALESEATTCDETNLNFTTKYDEAYVETSVKFNVFCKAFYRLESITVGGSLVYGYSKYTDNYENQVVIDAE